VAKWRERDPVQRLRLYLEQRALWSADLDRELRERARSSVDEAVRAAESAPAPRPEEIFSHTWAEPTPRQQREMKEPVDGTP
jgi:pyruvate dehydrogenase E1 component alpha subunit